MVVFGLAAALLLVPVSGEAQDEFERASLKGAGSTFVAPLVANWVQSYRYRQAGGIRYHAPNAGLDDEMHGITLDYEPVGSLAGIQRIKSGGVDFALTEMPLPAVELQRHGLVQFPLLLGSVALVANLPHVPPGALRLNSAIIANIYLGKVVRWSDPAIRQLNPDITLPDAPINVVHRNDGSGTTFTLTSYLSSTSTEWRQRVGVESLAKWPTGLGAKGSRGMVDTLRNTANSLGYIDEVQARQSGLRIVAIQNARGNFVLPGNAGTIAAAQAASWNPAVGFYEVLVDTKEANAYPIVASVFGLISNQLRQTRYQRTLGFFDWTLAEGQAATENLGYVPLPPAVSIKVRSELARRAKGS